jgi:hypothetical protein
LYLLEIRYKNLRRTREYAAVAIGSFPASCIRMHVPSCPPGDLIPRDRSGLRESSGVDKPEPEP